MELLPRFVSILLVLGLLLALLWWLQRKNLASFAAVVRPRKAGQSLRVIGRVALTAQHSIQIVRVADTALVVAVQPAGCSLLQTMPAEQAERDSRHRAAGAEI